MVLTCAGEVPFRSAVRFRSKRGGCPLFSCMPLVVPGPRLFGVGAHRVRQDSRSCVMSVSVGAHRARQDSRSCILTSRPIRACRVRWTVPDLRLWVCSSRRDDVHGCSSPGLWPLAVRDFHPGVLRSLAAGSMAGSPLTPRVAVCLGKCTAGFATCATALITARRVLAGGGPTCLHLRVVVGFRAVPTRLSKVGY